MHLVPCVSCLLPVVRDPHAERAGAVALPVYYLAVAAFVLLTIRGFFRRNQKQYHKFLPRGEAAVGGKMVPQQIVA